jgi:poly[(R)-3-hydroxyalkanoate] polymerase subunit PhaC
VTTHRRRLLWRPNNVRPSAISALAPHRSSLTRPGRAELRLAVPERAPAVDVDEPVVVEAPDTALLKAVLGMARRPVAGREAVALARRLARDPRRAARPVADLLAETGRVVAGRSELQPWIGDRRYDDVAWRGNPLFRALAQVHAAVADSVVELLDEAQLDPPDDYRLRIAATNLVAALAPPNFPLLNPAALKAVIDTGGRNLLVGTQRFWKDIRSPPRLPARSHPGDFELGRDVAATPGAVVQRTNVMELIQYEPTTPEVQAEPLLIVPPVVNKFYLMDLSPGRSLVEFLVDGGFQTFSMSWINPDRRHREFGLDTYISAILEALDGVLSITGAARAHTFGLCGGGEMLAIAAGYLAATSAQQRIASMTLPVCVTHHDDPASPGGLLTKQTAELLTAQAERKSVIKGATLQGALAWLRPIDSVWWAWVQRYLLAAEIPKLDLFYWSEDITDLPAALVRDLLKLALENALAHPGKLTVLGKPVNMRKVEVDAYLIAGLTDHLTPWRSCYRTATILGSRCEFVLVTGGHLQVVVRPPGGRAAVFRTAAIAPSDPDAWLRQATAQEGSWWVNWLDWLKRRSSGQTPALTALGDDDHRVLEPAPGAYVRKRVTTR